MFFLHSGPSRILGSDGKQKTALTGASGARELLHFQLVLINRFN